ncbi:uncharacterized protein LOC125944364 [Dermacentor silvarum]|uniref:uncharacterized protein LOC125944364 n=1 Tax=Dermacentor silvarum TaxID=543639 RepID=UPI002100FBD0|nr:uncharacterized protein LOC125944364 [Dermacentor silvarum]
MPTTRTNSSSISSASSSGAPLARLQGKKPRRCFTNEEDLCILRVVSATRPFGDDLKWMTAIENLKPALGRELTLRGLKDRVDLLIGYWRQQDTRNLRKSGTEEQYAEKEQILQDLSDYARSVNYVPKIAPRSAASAVRMKRPATPYRLTMPPTKQVRAEEAEGQESGQHAAQLLLTMPDQTPSSPSVIVGYMEATDQHTIEIIPDNQQPLKEEDEEEQLQRTQLQRQQIQPPPVARQQALPAMNEGIRGLEGMELNLLTMRQSHEFELRQKELDIEKRKVDNEERRLALEARKLDLAERKHQMEVSCRQREHQELLQHIEQFFSKHTKKISDLINTRQVSHE